MNLTPQSANVLALYGNPGAPAAVPSEEAAEAPAAAAAAGLDPKTMLNTFCQRYCKRAISKTDIVYTSQKIDSVYQAVVRLNCLDGIEFAGEVAPLQKDAEKNAAQQAMVNYSSEFSTLQPASKTNKKRKAPGEPAAFSASAADPAINNAKVALNTGLMRILHRALTKDDVQYNTLQTALGFQCTISLPSLPGEWAGFAWAGEVANKKKDAEEHAARHAVEALRADEGMSVAMDTPPTKAPKTTGKGKGSHDKGGYGGYGGGYDKGGGYGYQAMPMYGKGGFDKGWGKGWGKGGGKQPRNLTRERITTEPISGAVLEWKDRYGWLSLHQPLDHPQAAKNGGKVYLNMKDWQLPETLPMEGMNIQMHVYADESGLGAEEASPLDGV